MKLLLTSDSQAEFSNLDLCEKSHQELLAAIQKYKPDAVIHCGDLKESYNPCDLRVVKFWIKATKEIVATGVPFLINLGNHDRISQSRESKNWLDVLRVAGAVTFTKPRIKRVEDGAIAFLPFTADKALEREWAKQLAIDIQEYSGPKVLIFHTEVAGAILNSFGKEAVGNDPAQLHFNAYDVCLGGHIHGYQQVAGNAWYVGSPFCQDWSEANQTKGLVLVTIEAMTSMVKSSYPQLHVSVSQLKTSIPHWYDEEYLEENNIKPEPGAYIRFKVSVTSKKISAQLQTEERRLAKMYPGSRLYVIPDLQTPQKLEVELTGNTDLERVEQYVASTFPGGARFIAKRGVSYLSSKLGKIAPGTAGKRLRFLKITSRNVLCFKEAGYSFHKQGLVLIRGENKDWPKRSNGSGKTSALSLLLIALFGQTTKGQRNDQWANENTEEPAEVHLTLRDEKKRLIEIIRGRRPHKLLMKINDEDVSTGLTGKGKQETQGQIEKTIGFDLDMLLNSVYIDQTLTNGFVFGSQKARMDLIGKLCDLERFDQALKLVTLDIRKNEQEVLTQTNRADTLQEELDGLESDLQETTQQLSEQTPWTQQAKLARAEVDKLAQQAEILVNAKSRYVKIQTKLNATIAREKTISEKILQRRVQIQQLEKEAAQAKTLIDSGNCPMCHQPARVAGTAWAESLVPEYARVLEIYKRLNSKQITLHNEIVEHTEQMESYGREMASVNQKLKEAQSLLKQAEEGESIETKRTQQIVQKSQQLKSRLSRTKRILTATRAHLKNLDVDRELLEYSQKAFHRSGMPLYLAGSLCPLLNQAAGEYSEIFTEGKIQVTFSIIDNEFVIDIINPHGSHNSNGQSVGESSMAGIVTAFALREACPRTNLVILDEPGHGLDSVGAKQFARGLIQLKESGRWGTILVTTHSSTIESYLAGETQWVVTKQNGISTLSR